MNYLYLWEQEEFQRVGSQTVNKITGVLDWFCVSSNVLIRCVCVCGGGIECWMIRSCVVSYIPELELMIFIIIKNLAVLLLKK